MTSYIGVNIHSRDVVRSRIWAVYIFIAVTSCMCLQVSNSIHKPIYGRVFAAYRLARSMWIVWHK